MPVCESCNRRGIWRNGDGSFACSWHKEGRTAVYLGKERRVRLAEWAKNLPNEGTVRLMRDTYLHVALAAAFNGKKRFVDLRDNAQNAGSLQKALILGFIEKETLGYFITKQGREVLYSLFHAQAGKFIKVAYHKNDAWARHAQTHCW